MIRIKGGISFKKGEKPPAKLVSAVEEAGGFKLPFTGVSQFIDPGQTGLTALKGRDNQPIEVVTEEEFAKRLAEKKS